VERKLLLDGSSRVLSWCMGLCVLVQVLSVGTMVGGWFHARFMPTFHTEWVIDAVHAAREVLIPALFVVAAVTGLMGYAVLIGSHLNHAMNRVRAFQVGASMVLGGLAVVIAVIWMS
jgi:carbohydrate-binding DOMON domain-containing protein